MMEIAEVEKIHAILLEKFGGAKGIRDRGILESALARPFQTFDGKELYTSPIEKAAALFESIITNHPFIDGNKRTAYVLMRLLLMQNKLDIETSPEIKYDFVIKSASGLLKFDQQVEWISNHLKRHS